MSNLLEIKSSYLILSYLNIIVELILGIDKKTVVKAHRLLIYRIHLYVVMFSVLIYVT